MKKFLLAAALTVPAAAFGQCMPVEKLIAAQGSVAGAVPSTSALPDAITRLIEKEKEKEKKAESEPVSGAQLASLKSSWERLIKVARTAPALGVCIADAPNAFAATVGIPIVGFTTGLLKLVGNDRDALAFILAHELAHHVADHHARMTVKGRSVATAAVSAASEEAQGTGRAGVAWLRARQTADKVAGGFSREFETEADETGYQIMLEAGFDPRGAMRAAKLMRAEGGNYFDDYSTHSGWDERITRLEKMVEVEVKRRDQRAKVEGMASLNAAQAAIADRYIAARRWTEARRFVAGWLREMPESGTAWYYEGLLLRRSAAAAGRALDAFEKAVNFDPANDLAWQALCTGLYSGHRRESAHCARNIEDWQHMEAFRADTFGHRLVVGGRPGLMPPELWMATDSQGRKIITNDPAVLKARGLPQNPIAPQWRR